VVDASLVTIVPDSIGISALIFDRNRYGTVSVAFDRVASLDHVTSAAAGRVLPQNARAKAQRPSVPIRIVPAYSPVLREV
jgi:hypothetical protein